MLRSWLVHAQTRRRRGGELVDDAVQPFLEGGGAEIDEQADGEVHQAKIGQELLAVHRGEMFDGFELDDDALTVMVTEFELLLAYVVEPP